MGGNQNENGRSRAHDTQMYSEDSFSKAPSTSKVKDHSSLSLNRQSEEPSSTSYFSTLEIPQSFSFEQKFRRSNASFLSNVQFSSHDRSLSSPLSGRNQFESSNHMNCFSNSQEPSVHFPHLGQSGEMVRGATPTKSEQSRRAASSRVGSSRSASSLKRQKYIEKRRHSSPCWPMQVRKRGPHSDDEDEGISMQPVRKVFVNEERMAARFDSLSLSSHHGHSSSTMFGSRDAYARRVMEDIDSRLMDSDDDDDDEDEVLSRSKYSGVQRLQMSDHLKIALKQSQTEVLPDKIAQKIANPCTAMILWQPPDVASACQVTPSRDCEETDMAEEDIDIERPFFSGNLLSSMNRPNSDGLDEHMEL